MDNAYEKDKNNTKGILQQCSVWYGVCPILWQWIF